MKMGDWEYSLHQVTYLITGKTIHVTDKRFEQTQRSIGVSPGDGNLLFAIHEIGHWIAATSEERLFDNLGLSEELTEHSLTREIQAREISNFIFKDWIELELDPKYKEYAEYLTRGIFRPWADPTVDDVWIRASLDQSGVNLIEVNEILWKPYGNRRWEKYEAVFREYIRNK